MGLLHGRCANAGSYRAMVPLPARENVTEAMIKERTEAAWRTHRAT